MVITRIEAKAQGLKRYLTGEPCKHNHIAERLVCSGECCECITERRKRRSLTDVQYDACCRRRRESLHRRYAIVGEAYRERSRNWKKINPDRCRQMRLKEDKAKRAFYERNRKARKRHALPAWADLEKIAAIYELAAQMTRDTGIEHSVDHIYPIMGKTCCGLHVECNLRVIKNTDNRSKSNQIPLEFDTWANPLIG